MELNPIAAKRNRARMDNEQTTFTILGYDLHIDSSCIKEVQSYSRDGNTLTIVLELKEEVE